MTIGEAWETICNWLQEYAGEQPAALIISAVALLYLLLFNKDIRVRIILLILFLAPAIINPILYVHVYQHIRYWRLFWMLPEGLLIAAATIDLCGRIKGEVFKCVCLALASALVIVTGSNVFLRDMFGAGPTDNLYGVNAEVKSVCDAILSDNPHPKCIFVDWIYCETRMYSGDIEQLYGRDFSWYIYPIDLELRDTVSRWMSSPRDWNYMFDYAKAHDITHVCIPMNKAEDIAPLYGFTLIAQRANRSIFRNDNLALDAAT